MPVKGRQLDRIFDRLDFLFSATGNWVRLTAGSLTSNRTFTFPDRSGIPVTMPSDFVAPAHANKFFSVNASGTDVTVALPYQGTIITYTKTDPRFAKPIELYPTGNETDPSRPGDILIVTSDGANPASTNNAVTRLPGGTIGGWGGQYTIAPNSMRGMIRSVWVHVGKNATLIMPWVLLCESIPVSTVQPTGEAWSPVPFFGNGGSRVQYHRAGDTEVPTFGASLTRWAVGGTAPGNAIVRQFGNGNLYFGTALIEVIAPQTTVGIVNGIDPDLPVTGAFVTRTIRTDTEILSNTSAQLYARNVTFHLEVLDDRFTSVEVWVMNQTSGALVHRCPTQMTTSNSGETAMSFALSPYGESAKSGALRQWLSFYIPEAVVNLYRNASFELKLALLPGRGNAVAHLNTVFVTRTAVSETFWGTQWTSGAALAARANSSGNRDTPAFPAWDSSDLFFEHCVANTPWQGIIDVKLKQLVAPASGTLGLFQSAALIPCAYEAGRDMFVTMILSERPGYNGGDFIEAQIKNGAMFNSSDPGVPLSAPSPTLIAPSAKNCPPGHRAVGWVIRWETVNGYRNTIHGATYLELLLTYRGNGPGPAISGFVTEFVN